MTPEIVLLARALEVDAADGDCLGSAALFGGLELSRAAYDRRDEVALGMWRRVLPVLLRVRGNGLQLRGELQAIGYASLADQVLECPAWFRDRAEPTRALIDIVNLGRGARWELPDRARQAPHHARALRVAA